ncbi:hypothetical protein [Streptomyces sp. NPDC059970]|uniref:hypothetical protein n=1 Tax=Streptomyces sp. NPDC059970 TaxID=3347019 RepID=UPI0036CE5135
MAAPQDTSRIEYRLSQYAAGISPPVDLNVSFQVTPENAEAVDEAAEAAIRALITSLETRYPGVPVGTERVYESHRIETDWSTRPPAEGPLTEEPPAETPPDPPADEPTP